MEALINNNSSVDLTGFTDDEKNRIKEISAKINIDDAQETLQYGVSAQKSIASFSDNILNTVRSKDSGYVGDMLTDLLLNVKEMDVDNLAPTKGGFFSKIPFLGSLVDSAKKFVAKYDKISVQIDKVTDKLDNARMELLKDISMFDNLYKKNLEYFRELNILITAGKLKVKECHETIIPQQEEKIKAAAENEAPMEAQALSDIQQKVNRFDKNLHNLLLSRNIALQTGPQIRLVQNANQELVEKIQSSILNTIPLWKNQIVIALGLYKQQKALQLQREVSDTTNELLRKNAEMLKANMTGIAKESERGIVDIETLRKTNADLISTIEETLNIQREGRNKRVEVEKELLKMESDLKNKLLTLK
ncbi:MAG: toxic anion resistance protein [Candidatus Magnetoovum sp. WYHC-5]|nr:toxic anion resistance protein [Candidatus Magnetoovum sp. WYHC-5]